MAPRQASLWKRVAIGEHSFWSLNLDHPWVTQRVLEEMANNVAVFYDRRWPETEQFSLFLLEHPQWVADRTVLALGVGVGLETLLLGHLCQTLYINDLAPIALELCALQLQHNGMTNFLSLPGSYETLALPPVDLIVGCYLVYNTETLQAMQHFLARPTPPVLLFNSAMPDFQRLLQSTSRTVQALLPDAVYSCCLFF